MAEVEVPSSAERGLDSFPEQQSPSEDLSASAIAVAAENQELWEAEEEYCKRTSRRRLLSPEGSRRRSPPGYRTDDRD